MIEYIWNNWLILAFVAPFVWAIVNIIDLYFVASVYEDEYDGAIISGFFQIIPWFLVPFVGIKFPDMSIIYLSILGGIFFCIAMFYYFKALFATGDASLIQVFWNLVPLLVPILAFIFLGEKLSSLQYIGIAITFFGAMVLSFNKEIRAKNFKNFLLLIFYAIVFLSLSMVVQAKVYSASSFFSGFLFFTLGYFIGSIFILSFRKKKSIRHLIILSRKYWFWFILIESINLLAIVFSQRTIDISPSVSFVAVIESFVPAFILSISVILYICLSLIPLKRKDIIKNIYKEQLSGSFHKIIAIVIMAFGIYLINF